MIKKSIFSIFFISTLLFTGCNDTKDTEQKKEQIKPISKNDFTLISLDNTEIKIHKDENGFSIVGDENKIVIFDIFATWCPPCKAEATHLTSLQNKYQNDIVVIGLSIEDPVSDIALEEFRENNDANYLLIKSNDKNRLIDAIAKNVEAGKRYPIPFIAMYKNSKLDKNYFGAIEEEFLESDIKRMLGK